MQKLKNTEQDRNALYTLLATGVKPRATFGLGCFSSDLASSLEIVNYEGVVTKIDLDSGYCNWENIQGDSMPSVNINVITLHKRL